MVYEQDIWRIDWLVVVKTILSAIIIQSMFNFSFDSSFLSFQFDIFANFSENIFLKIQIFDKNLIQVFDSKSQTPTKTLTPEGPN